MTKPHVMLAAPAEMDTHRVEKLLQDCSLSVTVVFTGQEAATRLVTQSFPLVFWDVNLMQGIPATLPKERESETTLFAYSHRKLSPAQIQALAERVDWLFPEPLTLEFLFKGCVRALVDSIYLRRLLEESGHTYEMLQEMLRCPRGQLHLVHDLWFRILSRLEEED